MTQRIKNKSLEEGERVMTPDRSELKFLERNLEELSRAHKKVPTSYLGSLDPRVYSSLPPSLPQTISENVEMAREIPKLHAILASKSKRIGELEHLLRETKLTANQEFERLRAENERMQQSYQAKLKEKERECKWSLRLPLV